MSESAPQPRPTDLRYKKAERRLEVLFDDGAAFSLPAELLRVESPSAEVQGHSPSEKQLIWGRRNVGIIGITPVGHYAVAITFDDLHDSGIFTWDYLYKLGREQDQIWQAYLAALAAAGKSRDPQ